MASTYEGKEYTVYRGLNGTITATPAKIPTLGPHDVLIKITHTGVCFTDREFFRLGAPLALGHEGVGEVVAVGSAVTSLKVGDRAGGGFHRASCGHCRYCLSGRDIYCNDRVIFGEADYNNGTFGDYYVGRETYVHRIPEALSSEAAAPLQCAGATVYSALVSTVRSSDRVGVMGIGGLGHLAIQFAAKLGAEVVVFSTSKDKEAEAREFGASEFILVGEVDSIKAPIDHLIVSGNAYPDWEKFLNKKVLAREGTVVLLAAPTSGPLTVPAGPVFWEGYHLQSSLVASRKVHDDMLEFAARHGIKPKVEVYEDDGAEGITKIIERLEANKVRYRAVIAHKH